MDAQPSSPAFRIDPLFSSVFLAATILNLLLALLLRVTVELNEVALWGELAFFSFFHALLGVRILSARRYAARQRATDLAMYQRYADQGTPKRSN